MKDILKKYKKHKKISNIGVIITSLVLAIGINILILDDSIVGNNLKANILETKSQNQLSDIYGTISDYNEIFIQTSKTMNDVKNISMSINYNPENLEIKDIYSLHGEVLTLNNENGIYTLLLNLPQSKTISSHSELLKVNAEKNTENISEQLNISNANFTDSEGEKFLLSTSGVTY